MIYLDVPVNASFDPFSQIITIILRDGVTPYYITISSIDELRTGATSQAFSEGVQLGAATILLIAILLMTKPDKRRSVIFLLNALSLALVVIRGIFTILTLLGPFYEYYRWETLDYVGPGIRHAQDISVCGEVFSFLLVLAIEVSLVMQVRIVLCNLNNPQRFLINAANVIMALTAVSLRFAVMVLNIDWDILNLSGLTHDRYSRLNRVASAGNITLVISIAFSCIIFSGKLAHAIETRRSIGMRQFGAMQIIFVMGCQTMLTPLIFCILTYWGVKNALLQTFVPTLVAISLPLSGMWATCSTNNAQIARPEDGKQRAIPLGADNLSSGKRSRNTCDTVDSREGTLIDHDEITSKTGLTSPTKRMRQDSSEAGGNEDLEMQKISMVTVDRTYSVRSD